MEKIISINNLSIAFNKFTEVVKNVNIDVVKGKTTAIVGESGSGKTLSALSILKLLPNGAKINTGEIKYNNKNLLNLSQKEIQNIRGNKISTIFQEPMTSLNPLHTINKQIEEIITTNNTISKKAAVIRAYGSIHIPSFMQIHTHTTHSSIYPSSHISIPTPPLFAILKTPPKQLWKLLMGFNMYIPLKNIEQQLNK